MKTTKKSRKTSKPSKAAKSRKAPKPGATPRVSAVERGVWAFRLHPEELKAADRLAAAREDKSRAEALAELVRADASKTWTNAVPELAEHKGATEQVSMRLAPEERKAADARAKACGLTTAKYVRALLCRAS